MRIGHGANDRCRNLPGHSDDLLRALRQTFAIRIGRHHDKIRKPFPPPIQVAQVLLEFTYHGAMPAADVLPIQFDVHAVFRGDTLDDRRKNLVMRLVLDEQGDVTHRSRPASFVPIP
jgi:hypothetical protein